MHICKSFTFDAAHKLDRFPDGHPCARLHGHTYRVELIVVGPLDTTGIICDYADIAAAWAPIHEALDHRYLNEIPGLETPTTEIMANWIYERLCKHRMNSRFDYFGAVSEEAPEGQFHRHLYACISRVRVYESSTTYAEAP